MVQCSHKPQHVRAHENLWLLLLDQSILLLCSLHNETEFGVCMFTETDIGLESICSLGQKRCPFTHTSDETYKHPYLPQFYGNLTNSFQQTAGQTSPAHLHSKVQYEGWNRCSRITLFHLTSSTDNLPLTSALIIRSVRVRTCVHSHGGQCTQLK